MNACGCIWFMCSAVWHGSCLLETALWCPIYTASLDHSQLGAAATFLLLLLLLLSNR